MVYLNACFISMVILCKCGESAQEVRQVKEKKIGLSIANKLDSLVRLQVNKTPSKGLSGLKRTSVQNQHLDLMILLDSSASVGGSRFIMAKMSLKTIVDHVNAQSQFSLTGSRMALIKFSSPSLTSLVFGFGDHNGVTDIKNAIDAVSYDHGSSTALGLALSLALIEFQQNGGSGNAKILWVLTDGESNIGGSPIPPALQLQNLGATICVVAIGSSVNMTEINAIASPGCVFNANSFTSYSNAMSSVGNAGGAESPRVLPVNFFKKIKF